MEMAATRLDGEWRRTE